MVMDGKIPNRLMTSFFKFNSTSPSVLDLDRLLALQTIHEFKARDTGFILVVANQAAVRFSKSFPYFSSPTVLHSSESCNIFFSALVV